MIKLVPSLYLLGRLRSSHIVLYISYLRRYGPREMFPSLYPCVLVNTAASSVSMRVLVECRHSCIICAHPSVCECIIVTLDHLRRQPSTLFVPMSHSEHHCFWLQLDRSLVCCM
jgi:hypothetical protein